MLCRHAGWQPECRHGPWACTHDPVKWFQLGAQTGSVPTSTGGGRPTADRNWQCYPRSADSATLVVPESSTGLHLHQSGDRSQVNRLGDSGRHSSGTIVSASHVLITLMGVSLTALTTICVVPVEHEAFNGPGRSSTDGSNFIKSGAEAVAGGWLKACASTWRTVSSSLKAVVSEFSVPAV